MCGSIREFGFKIPSLVRSDGEVADGRLRLKAAHTLDLTEIPVTLCLSRVAIVTQVTGVRDTNRKPGQAPFSLQIPL